MDVLARKAKLYNCTKCAELDELMRLYCQDTSFSGIKQYDKAYAKFIDHYRYECTGAGEPMPRPKKGTHEGNGKHNGLFAFTLTFSPTDGKNQYDLLNAVDKLMTQKTCPVKKYMWYLETKENGSHPHVHGVYQTESGGQIHTKVFKRYWSIWDPKSRLGAGFRGGYHKPVDSAVAYKEYIEKDGGTHKSAGDWST